MSLKSPLSFFRFQNFPPELFFRQDRDMPRHLRWNLSTKKAKTLLKEIEKNTFINELLKS